MAVGVDDWGMFINYDLRWLTDRSGVTNFNKLQYWVMISFRFYDFLGS